MASCHTHATCRRVRNLAIPTQPVGEYGILAIPTQPIGEYGVPPRNPLTTKHNSTSTCGTFSTQPNSRSAGRAVQQRYGL